MAELTPRLEINPPRENRKNRGYCALSSRYCIGISLRVFELSTSGTCWSARADAERKEGIIKKRRALLLLLHYLRRVRSAFAIIQQQRTAGKKSRPVPHLIFFTKHYSFPLVPSISARTLRGFVHASRSGYSGQVNR